MTTDYDKIAEAIAFVCRHRQEQPELQTIASAMHMSPYHFQRLFTAWAGISPKKFLQYLTLEHAKQLLAENQYNLFDTAYETGLSGTGRLHDLFVSIEGMTPGEYKNGGENLTIHYSLQQCRFGPYIIAATTKGICQLSFFDGEAAAAVEALKACWPQAKLVAGTDRQQQLVIDFFQCGNSKGQIPLHLKGSPFQLKVWQALLHIPGGDVCDYGTIARHIRQPAAARAVGTAIGRNPIGYIIPCHRVIRNMGITGGYRWGSIRKKAMLAWEAAKTRPAGAEA